MFNALERVEKLLQNTEVFFLQQVELFRIAHNFGFDSSVSWVSGVKNWVFQPMNDKRGVGVFAANNAFRAAPRKFFGADKWARGLLISAFRFYRTIYYCEDFRHIIFLKLNLLVAGSRISRLPSRYERDVLILHSPANCLPYLTYFRFGMAKFDYLLI